MHDNSVDFSFVRFVSSSLARVARLSSLWSPLSAPVIECVSVLRATLVTTVAVIEIVGIVTVVIGGVVAAASHEVELLEVGEVKLSVPLQQNMLHTQRLNPDLPQVGCVENVVWQACEQVFGGDAFLHDYLPFALVLQVRKRMHGV